MNLVVFDMDGTLIDSGAEIARRVFAAFAALGLPQPSLQAIHANVGLSLAIYVGRVAGTDDPDLIERLVAAYRAASANSTADQMPLFAGARAALERLHKRDDLLLGVATGKGMAGVTKVLAQAEIGHYFVTLQTPDTNPSKPHPGMLLSAMDAVGVGPMDTVMIGDAVFDIEMAGAAGVRSIGVSWGLQPVEALRAAGATAILNDFADLEFTIDAILETSHA
jgi:phosphoglycolate phosphatase